MMRGYLTVFLSLSLSALIGFVLLLAGNAVKNAEKVRLECISDIGLNSVLSEFSVALQERYELFYIDTSYLGGDPSISRMEERLDYYIRRNLDLHPEDKPWTNAALNKVVISEQVVAAEGKGSSMKYQAAKYIEDSGITREEAEIFPYLEIAASLDQRDVCGEWSSLQEQIAGIELPQVLNEKGELTEVPLGNPADRVFGFTGSDILYLLELDMDGIGAGRIRKQDYISGRELQNVTGAYEKGADNEQFLTYLFEKMGNYRTVREDSFLSFQLEYIAQGEASDYENLKAVADRLVNWRFAVNYDAALSDAGLYEEANSLAASLYAVQLKKELEQPVTLSILYACAYLESLAEVKTLLGGGRVESQKDSLHIGMDQILSGELPSGFADGAGLSYEQHLACMVMLAGEESRNLRSMDIMEMDIRALTGNPDFAMDFCVGKFCAQIFAKGMGGEEYSLCRTYGYD